jgi:TP901 family phage tail tape measure protein
VALDSKDLVYTVEVKGDDAINFIKTLNRQLVALTKNMKVSEDVIEKESKATDKNTKAKKKNSKVTDKLSKSENKLKKAFKGAHLQIIAANQALQLVTSTAGILVRPFAASSNAAREFGKAISEINTLLTDFEITNAGVAQQVTDLSIAFGKESTETAKAFYQAISSGATDAANAQELMSAAGMLAVGGVTTLDSAVDGLTTIMNAYSLNTSESLRVTDAMFIAMKKGKTTIGELTSSISGVTPIAQNMNVSLEEMLAILSAVTTDGTTTGAAVTQLTSILTGLAKQTGNMKGVLKKLNIGSIAEEIKKTSLVETLEKVVGATDGTIESLTEIFGRKEAVLAALTLMGNGADNFADTMTLMGEIAEDVGGQTKRAFELRKESIQFEQSVERVQAAMRVFGDMINAVFIPAFVGLSKALKGISDGFRFLGTLLGTIDSTTASILALTGAIIALNSSAGAAVAGKALSAIFGAIDLVAINAAAAAFGRLALSMIQFIAIGAGVLTVVVAIDVLVRNLEKLPELMNLITAVFIKSFNNIKIIFFGLSQAFAETMVDMADSMGALGGNMADNFRNDMKSSAEAVLELSKANDELDSNIKDLSKTVDTGFAGKLAGLMDEMINGIDKVKGSFDDVGTAAKQAGKDIKRALTVEQLEALNELIGKTAELEAQFNSLGKSEVQRIQITLDLELKKLDVLEEQLRLQAKLSAAASAELDKQRQLQKDIAGGKTTEANIKAGGDVSGGLSTIGGAASSAGQQFGSEALGAMGEGMTGMASSMGEAIAGPIAALILKLPDILNMFADFINKITELPTAIAEGVANLFDSVKNIVADLIPNIIIMVKDILMSIGDLIAELPDILFDMLDSLPDLIIDLFEAIPDVIANIIKGLVKSIPLFLAAMIKLLVRGLPKMIEAFVKMIPEIVEAIAEGLKEAFHDIINAIGEIFGISSKETQEQIDQLSEDLSKSAEDTFAVLDIAEGATAENLSEMITDAAKSAVDILQMWWDKFVILMTDLWRMIWDGIVNVWSQVWDNVLKPIANLIKDAWSHVWDKLVEVWQHVWDNFLGPIADFGKMIWDGFINAIEDIGGAIFDIGKKIWDGLWDGLSAVGESFKAFGNAIWEGLKDGVSSIAGAIWDGIKGLATVIGDAIKNALGIGGGGGVSGPNEVSLKNLGGRLGFSQGGAVPYPGQTNKFANGGAVPGFSSADSVNNVVQPGEFVMSHQGRATLGDEVLNAANSGKNISSGGGGRGAVTNNISVVINPAPGMNEREIGNAVIEQIKRESSRGVEIMNQRGIFQA